MTEQQIKEVIELKTFCTNAALQVERALANQKQADQKLKDFLYELMQKIPSVQKDTLEECICAAILMPGGEVVRGHRHDSCYDVVRKRPAADREIICRALQGFVTSRNRFVDRYEGMALQRAAGKESAIHGELRGDQLFSEDLYMSHCEISS